MVRLLTLGSVALVGLTGRFVVGVQRLPGDADRACSPGQVCAALPPVTAVATDACAVEEADGARALTRGAGVAGARCGSLSRRIFDPEGARAEALQRSVTLRGEPVTGVASGGA